MKTPLRATFRRTPWPAPLLPGAALLLGLFAFRPLLLAAFELPAGTDVERWFFTPEEKSPLLAIGLAGFLLWRRRAALTALPARTAAASAALLLGTGLALFAWAQLTRAADLLLPSLALQLLGFAAATRGLAGCRAVLLPVAVLLLGMPIPAPIRNELVWLLQRSSASGATWLLETFGADVTRHGVELKSGEYRFAVIASCSGLRGIEILTLVAVLVRELFAGAGGRAWLLLPLAPPLGFALNVVRIAVVVAAAASADPERPGPANWDHTPQGVAVLLAGTALLYGLGRLLSGPAPPPRLPETGDATARAAWPRWPAVVALAAGLGVLSVALRPFEIAPHPLPALEIPVQRGGWSSEELTVDRPFVGPLYGGQSLYRRYRQERPNGPPRIVDLFIGIDVSGDEANSALLSSRSAVPGRDWSLEPPETTRLWALGIEAHTAFATRGSERALVYTWRVRDEGLWRETLRALLALEAGPLRRETRRVVVRLSTPVIRDGPVGRDRSKRTLELFLSDFRNELANL